MSLPPLLAVKDIHERLRAIFPEGTVNRNYVTREIAAKTVFVMLYIGAVEGAECWLRPDQVARMTDVQAATHRLGDPRQGRMSGGCCIFLQRSRNKVGCEPDGVIFSSG